MGEFSSDWHRARYLENLEAELAAIRGRGGDPDAEQAVEAELTRLGSPARETRPAGKAKQTRGTRKA